MTIQLYTVNTSIYGRYGGTVYTVYTRLSVNDDDNLKTTADDECDAVFINIENFRPLSRWLLHFHYYYSSCSVLILLLLLLLALAVRGRRGAN